MNPNRDTQSSTAPSASSPPSPSLQRGKACLSCRRRKMRCDGVRPVCTPCLRGERTEDCEYTDGSRRPRTLALEEDVLRLRERVRELENPEEAVASVELHAPYATAGPSATGSTSMAYSGMPAPYYQAGSAGQAQPYAPPSDSEADMHARHALSVIAPHVAELGFFLDLDRLRISGARILPALQSALTLWSVHITSMSDPDRARSLGQTQALASNLLSQAQTQLAFALSTVDTEPDPAVFLHLVQTGVLLAYYMQRIGQVVGARYYASGSWAMGMTLKLYQSPHLSGGADQGARVQEGPTHGGANAGEYTFVDSGRLARALDGIEAEERVRAFWAVYALDRWFSAVGQWPCQTLATDGNAVSVPWPGAGGAVEARDVVRDLLKHPSHDFMQGGVSAMHAKASVLLGEATTVAALYVADHTISQSPAFQARFNTLDTLLRRCLNVAMTVATGRQSHAQTWTPDEAQAVATVHLVAFAHVTLHRPLISTYAPYRRRCAEAAFGVVQVLDRMGDVGAGAWSPSPVYATVWTVLCLALHEEVVCLRARPDANPSHRREENEMVEAIRKLASTLSALSHHSPNRFFASKIEAVLSVLESIAG